MYLLHARVSIYWFYLTIAFGIIWMLPWFPDKTGESLLPINVAYGTPFADWREILLVHVIASIMLAGIATILHKTVLWLATRFSNRRTAQE